MTGSTHGPALRASAWRSSGAVAAVLFSVIASSPAQAQTYRCTVGGRLVLSDRPCASGDALVAYGPARVQTSPGQPLRDPPKASDHVRYLGSGCASISEAIRTGPSRGVRQDVLWGLREEYRNKCALEDQEAQALAQKDRGQVYQQQRADRERQQSERQAALARADRCNGMRDVIAQRRQREPTLNDKDVAALRSLEATYNSVCLAP